MNKFYLDAIQIKREMLHLQRNAMLKMRNEI